MMYNYIFEIRSDETRDVLHHKVIILEYVVKKICPTMSRKFASQASKQER